MVGSKTLIAENYTYPPQTIGAYLVHGKNNEIE